MKPQYNGTNADGFTMNSSYASFKRIMSANRNLKSMEGIKEAIMRHYNIKDESWKNKRKHIKTNWWILTICVSFKYFSYEITTIFCKYWRSQKINTKLKADQHYMKHTHTDSIDKI